MNIFVLDLDPVIAAQSLVDRHVVKMCLETAQLLCSVYVPNSAPYKVTHYNHPCNIWARKSLSNYNWLIAHGLAIADEYTFRYNKDHASKKVIEWCDKHKGYLNDIGLTDFAQAVPEKYKCSDPVKAYRDYYCEGKKHLLKYTKREKPTWFVE